MQNYTREKPAAELIWDIKRHFWLQSAMPQQVLWLADYLLWHHWLGCGHRNLCAWKLERVESNTAVLCDSVSDYCALPSFWSRLLTLCGSWRMELKAETNSNNNTKDNSTPQLAAVFWIKKYASWVVCFSHWHRATSWYSLVTVFRGKQKHGT